MKTFQVNGHLGLSSIYVGESLSNVGSYLPDTEPVIITDTNIKAIYGDRFPKGPVITIGTGEKIKTLDTVEFILREMIHLGCDRSSFVLGIGGGIVCDIAGFAASIYLRGIGFGFVSTSLLSQVDASVGGKNGVNQDSFKNMVGVFNQPEFVICDQGLLPTLPKGEISNGLAEIVKHGLISDPDLLCFLEQNRQQALDLDPEVISRLVADSVSIKPAIGQKDEKEGGERRNLNFGHTIGHGIEKIGQQGHGRAVSLGIIAAALFSAHRGYLDKTQVERIVDLLQGLGLPTSLDHDPEQIIQAAARDKKKQGQHLFFVFLETLGRARVEKIGYDRLNDFIRSAFK